MYIEDGSKEDYSEEIISNRYSWGWLGDSVEPYQLGWADKNLKSQVLSKLVKMKSNGHLIMLHRGSHICEICSNNRGNGSFIIEHNGIEFRCPEMVSHYIDEHDYNPGEQVIDAVLNGNWEKEPY